MSATLSTKSAPTSALVFYVECFSLLSRNTRRDEAQRPCVSERNVTASAQLRSWWFDTEGPDEYKHRSRTRPQTRRTSVQHVGEDRLYLADPIWPAGTSTSSRATAWGRRETDAHSIHLAGPITSSGGEVRQRSAGTTDPHQCPPARDRAARADRRHDADAPRPFWKRVRAGSVGSP